MKSRKGLQSPRVRRVTVLVFCTAAFLFPINSHAQQPTKKSHYIRDTGKDSVIVFVHGVLGDSQSTWTNEGTKAYWPDLMKDDSHFSDFDIFVVGYPSTLFHPGYNGLGLVVGAKANVIAMGLAEERSHRSVRSCRLTAPSPLPRERTRESRLPSHAWQP